MPKNIFLLVAAGLLFSLFMPVAVLAQDTTGKVGVSTLDAEWQPVVAEHYIGIRGGWGVGSARFEPLRLNANYPGLLTFGIVYKFDVPKQRNVGTIQAELNYMEKGFQYETYNESGIFYSRRYSIIELPILWQPYVEISKSGSRLFLSAGPYVGYGFNNSSYRIYQKEGNITNEEGPYEYDPLRDNYFEYGIVAGGGLLIAVKRISFWIEFRYNIMLSDVLRGVDKYPGNPFRSPIDLMNLSAGIAYRIR